MADASSIRKATDLPVATGFYRGGIRWTNNQAVVSTGTQWAPLGNVILNVPLQIAADAVDQNIFIADRPYTIVSASEVHSVAGTDASAVTATVSKCTGTQAASAGVNMLTATFNLKSTANTTVAGVITATSANASLATGDRISVHVTGTTTALAGSILTIVLQPT